MVLANFSTDKDGLDCSLELGMTTRVTSFPTLSTDACDGCLSVTHELTKGLMVELIRCWGYFKRENRDFKRSHSSEI